MYRLLGLQDTHAHTALHWCSTVADNEPKLSRPKHYTQFRHKLEPSFILDPKRRYNANQLFMTIVTMLSK